MKQNTHKKGVHNNPLPPQHLRHNKLTQRRTTRPCRSGTGGAGLRPRSAPASTSDFVCVAEGARPRVASGAEATRGSEEGSDDDGGDEEVTDCAVAVAVLVDACG